MSETPGETRNAQPDDLTAGSTAQLLKRLGVVLTVTQITKLADELPESITDSDASDMFARFADPESEEPLTDGERLMLAENHLVAGHIDAEIARLEVRLRKSPQQIFPDGTVFDAFALCVLKRSKRALFAHPRRPNRIVFERFPRTAGGLMSYVAIHEALSDDAGLLSRRISDESAHAVLKACATKVVRGGVQQWISGLS